MKRITFAFVLAAVLAAVSVLSPQLFAQQTLTPTTLAAAVTSTTQSSIQVASATGISRNYILVIDSEAMSVSSAYVSGTTIPVTRGAGSTAVGLHATSTPVYFGPPNYFTNSDPKPGPCTAANEIALPRFVLPTAGAAPGSVSIYDCKGPTAATATWQRYVKDGWQQFSYGQLSGRATGAVTYTALGAITPQPGMVFVNGTTLAMTIISPTTAQNGMTMCVISANASAQTLTYTTTGFNGGGAATDLATFGGAVGDNICFTAVSGVWWIISTRNVTLS